MRAPDWFLKELKIFDPLLRVRWSARMELWHIERRVMRGLHPGTIKTDEWHDEYIRARDGYVHVCSVPPGKLTPHVFERLKAADLWSHGGWKKVADQLDEFDQVEEEKKWEVFSRDLTDLSKSVYDLLKLRDGRTVFNAGFPL
jgi:hypothetical protein